MNEPRCALAGDGIRCGWLAEASDGAPALCDAHLAIVREATDVRLGRVDLLPGPCRACGGRLGVEYPSGWLCAVCEWRFDVVPDPDVRMPRLDVVYYLRWRDRVKIGTTANPRQRFAALAHDEVVAFERGDRTLEQRRHAQFADHRIPGSEWFWTHDALEAHLAAVSAGVPDPWALLARWRGEAAALA